MTECPPTWDGWDRLINRLAARDAPIRDFLTGMGLRTVLVLLLCFGCAGAWGSINRPAPDRGPTEVRITAYVLDVDAVDSANQSFTLPLYFEVRWRDPRLAHDGAGPVSRGAGQIWYPQIKIANQQRVWRTFDLIAQVYPDGEVVGRQRLWGDFSQPLDLADFPFDRHDFGIQIVAAG